jgi:fatty-acyl-CoA synthase
MQRSLELGLQPDPERYTLARFLDDVAERHGPRNALRFQPEADAPVSSCSFEELRSAARALSKGLVAAGVGKGTRVALLMANRPEWVVSAFAVGLAGGVLVPVNTFATPEERDYILRHSDAALLLMQNGIGRQDFVADLMARHDEVGSGAPGAIRCPALPHLRRVVCLDATTSKGGIESWDSLLRGGVDVSDELLEALAQSVHPADDGLLIYTSGTTAHPKGVHHMQRAPVIQSWRFAEDMGLSPDDVVLTAQPFFWTAGICMSLGASLAAGASLILEQIFDAERFLALIEREKVTALHAWPHQEKSLAEHPDAKTRDLSSIEKIEFSSPLAPLAGLEKDVWGTYGSYGLSETFTLSSSLPANTPAELREKTSGRPLPGMTVKIVDIETGTDLPVGEKGEIAVRGATFMRGYYKVEPELYLDDNGFFRTQDGGSFDGDGFLHWSGRLGNLIKTGGANVSPLEIERVAQDFEELHVALAVGVPHPVLGEVIVLCAVKSEEPGAPDIDESALQQRLRERLAVYKVPKRVLFFPADALSYTGNQKIQVGPLRDLAMERLREEGAIIEGVTYGSSR